MTNEAWTRTGRALRRGGPFVCFLALGWGLLTPSSGHAWGAKMHEIVNRRAAQAVTGPAGEAWASFAVALGRHASDADHRKAYDPSEKPRHYIDIDAYAEPPFKDVPRTIEGLEKRFGPGTAEQWGMVPWAIEECYRMLVFSLRQNDWGSAGAWAADLGHYVADSHQPLHCTVNYDGQNTGNDGVHLRFEVHMMDRHFDEAAIAVADPLPDPGGDPVEFCFAWIADAYPGLAPVLRADDEARAVDNAFGDRYYEALWSASGPLATRQMSHAVSDLAALYAAAWAEAGRPPLPSEPPPFRALPVDLLAGPAPQGGSPPAALLVAGLAIVGALVLGSQ